MEQAQLKQLGQTFVDTLHQLEGGDEGAVKAMAGLFSADSRLTNAALVLLGQEHRGQDGAATFWGEYQQALGGARSEFHAYTYGEREVGLFWTTALTDPARRSDAYDGATLLVYDDAGKIQRFHGYYDTAQLRREPKG